MLKDNYSFHPKYDLSIKNKSFERWKKLMGIGEKFGCHQLPERSFFVNGYQLPVCARCTGVILGYIFAVPLYIKFGFRAGLSFFGCVAMLTDWSLQRIGIKESTNRRRFITGICGGIGILCFQIKLVSTFIGSISKENRENQI